MALHILKLCVGVDTLQELADWQAARLKQMKGPRKLLSHVTRMTPKRRDEILDGGSLYWVIKGNVQCRQRLTEIRPFVDGEGISRCRLVLDPQVIRTEWQPRRAFQGWRYLPPKDAPRDLKDGSGGWQALPPDLRSELANLGLL